MKIRIAALLLVALVSSATAEEMKGTCDVRFLATSTLHDFTGTVRCRPFTVTLADNPGGKPVISGAEIAVPVGEMDTKNEDRDVQMRKMFESEKFPRIVASLSNVDPAKIREALGKNPNGKGAVEFTLKIRDIERRIRADIRNLREGPGKVSFDAEFPVSLKEYDLKAPAVLFRLVRVGDTVAVKAAVKLETTPAK